MQTEAVFSLLTDYFLAMFAETSNKSIENYKYFSEAVRYNEIKLSTPEGGHLKW